MCSAGLLGLVPPPRDPTDNSARGVFRRLVNGTVTAHTCSRTHARLLESREDMVVASGYIHHVGSERKQV